MQNKNAIITIILVMLLVAASVFFFTSNESSAKIGEPLFLKCLGDFAAIGKNGETDLSLIYIDSNNSPVFSSMLKNSELSFNDKSVSIKKIDIAKGDQFGEIALYSLNLKLSLAKDDCLCEELIVLSSEGQEKKFAIGKIAVHGSNQKLEGLEIMKNTGVSSRLNRYELSLKNAPFDNVRVKAIETGLFSSIIDSIDYSISSRGIVRAEYLGNDIELPKDSTLDITINFDEDNQYDYYVYNPIIVYEINENEQSLSPFYATYGLSYNDEQMKQFEALYKAIW